MAKPDRKTVMQDIIDQVIRDFPLDAPEASICSDTCVGCPRKLIEMVESETLYWQDRLNKGQLPGFDELRRYSKMCKNIRRSLVRSGLMQ